MWVQHITFLMDARVLEGMVIGTSLLERMKVVLNISTNCVSIRTILIWPLVSPLRLEYMDSVFYFTLFWSSWIVLGVGSPRIGVSSAQ